MTDLRMLQLCAKAMKLRPVKMFPTGCTVGNKKVMEAGILKPGKAGKLGYWERYNPLKNDAQAMALIKRFDICLAGEGNSWEATMFLKGDDELRVRADSINRAVVECVATRAYSRIANK